MQYRVSIKYLELCFFSAVVFRLQLGPPLFTGVVEFIFTEQESGEALSLAPFLFF